MCAEYCTRASARRVAYARSDTRSRSARRRARRRIALFTRATSGFEDIAPPERHRRARASQCITLTRGPCAESETIDAPTDRRFGRTSDGGRGGSSEKRAGARSLAPHALDAYPARRRTASRCRPPFPSRSPRASRRASARVTAPPPRVASPPLARAPRRDALPPRSGAPTRRCTATRRLTLRSASVFSACPRRPSARSHPDPARPSPPRALPAARRGSPPRTDNP